MSLKSLSGINILTIVFISIILILLYIRKENFAINENDCKDNIKLCARYNTDNYSYCEPGHDYQTYMWKHCPKFCGKANYGPCAEGVVPKCVDKAGKSNCYLKRFYWGNDCNSDDMKKNC